MEVNSDDWNYCTFLFFLFFFPSSIETVVTWFAKGSDGERPTWTLTLRRFRHGVAENHFEKSK